MQSGNLSATSFGAISLVLDEGHREFGRPWEVPVITKSGMDLREKSNAAFALACSWLERIATERTEPPDNVSNHESSVDSAGVPHAERVGEHWLRPIPISGSMCSILSCDRVLNVSGDTL